MSDTLIHRGPDSSGYFSDEHVALGFRRLSLLDIEGGDQPLHNEDESLTLICNGEIFNYQDLKQDLTQRGHRFRTHTDVEVLLHLYEDHGVDFLNRLNGQFAFALYDQRQDVIFLARDHFGICPLFYTVVDGVLIFASEVKAILAHPLVTREVDLTGLDQVISFPGMVSPRTLFRGVNSLPSGHFLLVKNGEVRVREYWDLDYPQEGEISYDRPEDYYVNRLCELLEESVRLRLHADAPVGLYLSGGLDSSLIAAMANSIQPKVGRRSFSISFEDQEISESRYQRLVAARINSEHRETFFDWSQISGRLINAVFHSECALKETYNTASMALSQSARDAGVKAILTGEGADELFAGYVGYRFDQLRRGRRGDMNDPFDLDAALEQEFRKKLWGEAGIFYEIDCHSLSETKKGLYSAHARELLPEFDCLNFAPVRQERLRNRHFLHQRSYLDFKLRLSDHLISDHGDRMALANSVEARYPFLDVKLVEFAREIPPYLKLNDFTEKYIIRRVAEGVIPSEIIDREKYAFHAPGSSYLLRRNIEWINDLLSFGRVKRQGYFNPQVVENLKAKYSQDGFKLNLPFENDLLIIVLTFNIFLDIFKMPDLT